MQKLDLILMSNVIKRVVNIFGEEILLHEPQFRAAIKDCMGNDSTSPEGRIMVFTSEIGIGSIFYRLLKERTNYKEAFSTLNWMLSEKYGFQNDRVGELIKAYCLGVGLYDLVNNTTIWSYQSKHSYGVRYVEDYDVHRDRKRTRIWNLILKGDNVPIIRESISTKIYDGVTETTFFIYESDSEERTYDPEEGRLVGLIRLSNLIDSKSGDKTKLTMSIDSYGLMSLKVTDLCSGKYSDKIIQLS